MVNAEFVNLIRSLKTMFFGRDMSFLTLRLARTEPFADNLHMTNMQDIDKTFDRKYTDSVHC